MAQLQFRSDDTLLWEEKFGDGTDGTYTVGSNITDSPTKTTCSGTLASTTLNVGSSTGFAVGDIVIIHQSRDGSATPGDWQLNKINNISGTTWTMKYALVKTFDTTAQVQKGLEYAAATISSGFTLTSSAWDGSTGGIIFFLCNGTTTIDGTIDLIGKGYRGGAVSAGAGQQGFQGETTTGTGSRTTSAKSPTGGGGGPAQSIDNGGNGGSGGSHATAGTAGTGSNAATGTSGNAGLTVMTFGGAGGSAGSRDTALYNAGNAGREGGGIAIIITKDLVVTGSLTAKGESESALSGAEYPGGAGAGGSILLKAQTATLGTNLVLATGGTGGSRTAGGGTSGNGGDGRIHLDYLTSYTGTTSPTLDARQDSSLTTASTGGGSFIYMMM